MSAPVTTGAAAATPGRPSRALAALALSLLLGLQPATTDIYLPALPMLTRALGAPLSAAQLTMSATLLAFGLGQLFWGPVADRVGRRPVLLWGLGLYVVAALAAVFVGDIAQLVAWRAVQGVGLAAAVVVARAIVRDLYEPHEGAHVMSLALSGLGVIACAGPLLGGLVASSFGWRAALALVALFSAATLAFIAWRLPETIGQRNPRATALAPLLAQWRAIAVHRHFLGWALLVTCTYGGLYTMLAGSSFVYIEMLGLAPAWYGAAMASGSIAYLLGTLLCRRLIARHGTAGAVGLAAWLTLGAGVAMLAAVLAGWQSPWAVLLPQWLYCIGHGVHQPCGQTGAVGPFPRAAGAASALAGFLLALVAFGIGLFLGRALGGGVLPFAACVAFWSAATAAVAWTLVRRLR